MKTIPFIFILLLVIYNTSNQQTGNTYSVEDNFVASGYMGDINKIIIRRNFKDNSRPDGLCIRITYSPGDLNWAGVYWQYPANNWCKKQGKDFSTLGFTKLTFYVKGDHGGEEVKFKIGQDCGDSFVSNELTARLTKAWVKESIDLRGKDLSNITGAFCWVADANANPSGLTFYLDDIQFEK